MIIPREFQPQKGFTLIEISIVLVIIGLIVGGILVGRDLINASYVRAQLTQLEKYNTAVNTFKGKYGGYLPGDIKDPDATNFGFAPRGTFAGEGDGNGLIEGNYNNNSGQNSGSLEGTGETIMFWADLSKAGLIDGGFTAASSTAPLAANVTATSTPSLDAYFPQAKLGKGNYVYVWSGGYGKVYNSNRTDYNNYFGISVPNSASGGLTNSIFWSDQGMTVAQAYSIDTKIDDGMPQSGAVQALYLTFGKASSTDAAWATGTPSGAGDFDQSTGGPITSGTTNPHWDTGSASQVCYSNGQTLTPETYNLTYPANVNCALSFKFK